MQIITTTTRVYTSDVMPDVQTPSQLLAPIITWADMLPVAWKVVTQHKSRAFGIGAPQHLAWARQSPMTDAVLQRLYALYNAYHEPEGCFNRWRAQFTLQHYTRKGFRGGLFREIDGSYVRTCAALDYTPSTLPQVIARFVQWCTWGGRPPVQCITLDNVRVALTTTED